MHGKDNIVAETTPVLQAIWLDQFIEFERMNGCDEWWCDCLQLMGTAEQRSDAARDTIDEVIHGVKRKLKQRMFSKGECDNCGFKQTMLCPKCKVCTQCCGCNDEITEADGKETGKHGIHAVPRCMNVLDSMIGDTEWLYLTFYYYESGV